MLKTSGSVSFAKNVINFGVIGNQGVLELPEAFSEPFQISKMENFAKIVNS